MITFKIENDKHTLELPALTFGTADFCRQDDDEYYFGLLDKYVELGGTCIDTARTYCSWIKGGEDSSELIIGRWLKARNNRENMIISTKGGHPEHDNMSVSRLDAKSLKADLDRSLECLNTSYVDVYFLHRDDERIPVSKIMPILDGFVKSGKVRFLGASNWTSGRIQAANEYAEAFGLEPFRVSQINYSLAHSSTDTFGDSTLVCMNMWEYSWYKKNNFPVMAFSPQAKGFFAKHSSVESIKKLPEGQFTSTANLARLAKVKELSEKTGTSPAVIPLGYLNSQSFFVSSVFAASNTKQIEEDMGAQDLKYEDVTIAFLENLL